MSDSPARNERRLHGATGAAAYRLTPILQGPIRPRGGQWDVPLCIRNWCLPQPAEDTGVLFPDFRLESRPMGPAARIAAETGGHRRHMFTLGTSRIT